MESLLDKKSVSSPQTKMSRLLDMNNLFKMSIYTASLFSCKVTQYLLVSSLPRFPKLILVLFVLPYSITDIDYQLIRETIVWVKY